MNFILDTNIILSSVISNSTTRHLIIFLSAQLYYPEGALDEIVRNKSEIMAKAGIAEREFNMTLATLFKHIRVVKTDETTPHIKKADEIIGGIHKNDVIFIAAAIAKNAVVWSNDEHFKKQKDIRVVNTKELLSIL